MLRAVSGTESPPNFSETASARTRATIASATTPGGGHRADVGALVVGHRGLAGADVDGRQRAGHGGDRLHRRADPQHLADAHAALDTAGAVGRRVICRPRP